MHGSFRSILIPVDFSSNTDLAVKKGLEFCNEHTVLHLLHVKSLNMLTRLIPLKKQIGLHDSNTEFEVEPRLKILRNQLISEGHHFTITTSVELNDSVQRGIEHSIKKLNPDLLIIAKKSSASWFARSSSISATSLANRTWVPVLSVKQGALAVATRKVIVPVNSFFMEKKRELIHILSNRFHLTIHLVTFIKRGNLPDEFSASALLEMYKWIKAKTTCPVEHTTLYGTSQAKSLMNYAFEIEADMLVVTPLEETWIDMRRYCISDVLPKNAKVQVLSVA